MSDRVEIHPYMEVVEATVGDVYRRFSAWVEREDLLQEAAVWWYGPGQTYLPTYLAEDENLRRLRRSLWRYVARYAEREKAHKRGYEPCDQLRYHPSEITSLLPLAMDPDGVPDGGGIKDGPKPKGNLAEGGDVLAALIDVRRALSALTEDDLHFLTLAQDHAHDWDLLASYTGTLADSCRRRHARITERMARWLNNDEKEDYAA